MPNHSLISPYTIHFMTSSAHNPCRYLLKKAQQDFIKKTTRVFLLQKIIHTCVLDNHRIVSTANSPRYHLLTWRINRIKAYIHIKMLNFSLRYDASLTSERTHFFNR
mmetsp:Transcript_5050/g.8283  ORF Transcript_5050/g.8283 Transcript_5050/m.8283 type:complete len:107 (-) Transcript_5050:2439-2759(-)